MTKHKTMRDHFEAHWVRLHRRHMVASWLKRDDIWDKGSYAQPIVHFAWRAFKAGWKARSRHD